MTQSMIENRPHRRIEEWKYTDLRGTAKGEENGLTSVMLPHFDVPDGVYLSEGEGHKGDMAMSKLAAQFSEKSWNIYVPEGTKPDTALSVNELTQGHARVAIMLDKGAHLELVEHHEGPDKGFANIDLQVHLAKGASMTRIIVQNDPDTHLRVSTACVAAEEGAKFDQYILSLGGALCRLETQLYVEGEHVEANMNGAYLLDGKRHTDLTSRVSLKEEHGKIRQAVKGVATDESRGVFQGKFLVERKAQHTDAAMRHDALMLSDRAEVRAKPELEIYADDVACEHGNTIGALDESALFYMRQRGIPLARAKAMLTEAFVRDVFDGLPDESVRESILTKISDWLDTADAL